MIVAFILKTHLKLTVIKNKLSKALLVKSMFFCQQLGSLITFNPVFCSFVRTLSDQNFVFEKNAC